MRRLQVLDQELIILMAVSSVELHFGMGWCGRISLCFGVHELAGLVKDQCVALIAHLLVPSTMLAALGALPVWLLQNHEYAVIICLCVSPQFSDIAKSCSPGSFPEGKVGDSGRNAGRGM